MLDDYLAKEPDRRQDKRPERPKGSGGRGPKGKHKRMLSPTQITSFMACPRKWYYEYVEKIPVPERFPLVRGAVVHSTLENFFRWRPAPGWTYEELIENMEDFARSLLKMEWSDARVTEKFGDDRFEETMDMIMRFLQRHKWKMDPIFERYGDPHKAWNFSKPKFRELHVIDHELGVQGYIDAVIERDMDELILIDYKTGSVFRHPVEEEHHRQLFIYALLFERNHGKRPAYVAVDYLLHGQVANYPVRDNFLDEVKDLIAYVHANTKSKDISDYEPNTGYKFCKWCDFREPCQGEPSLQK